VTSLLVSTQLFLVGVWLGPSTPLPGGSFALYVGEESCRSCHSQDGSARLCTSEPAPKHADAFEALLTADAHEIAALSGVITPPIRTMVCLECHSAGMDVGPRWQAPTFRKQDGVQCESCHGPGSQHADQPASFPLPVMTRSDCVVCHTPRASHEEVLVKGFHRAPADLQYKTPTTLVVSSDGDRLYAVCEHSDSVVALDTRTGRRLGEVQVGRRPCAAALSAEGRTLYVANRLSGNLSIVDAHDLRSIAEIEVCAEPHGVAVDSLGRFAYVTCSGEDTVCVVDLEARTVLRRLTAGAGPWSIAADAEGRVAAVTNVRPQLGRFRDPPQSELTLIDLAERRVLDRRTVDQANMLQGIAWSPRFSVALFTLMRTKNLVPATRLAQGWVVTNGLGVLWPDGRVDQVLLDEPDFAFPDLMDLAVSPDGRLALVTSGGADEAVVVDIEKLLKVIADATPIERDILPDQLGTSRAFIVKRIPVGINPRGVRFAPDGKVAYVANALDDTISVVDMSELRLTQTLLLGGPSETTELRRGERLFHSAAITFGRQFSCRSCHPDGHTNGLTLDIEADGLGMKPVENRSLRGVFDTAPFKWEGTNPTLYRQCGPRFAVFFTRMSPYSPPELDALVHYMATIERVPNRFRSAEGLTLAQRRGKAVFERTTLNNGTTLEPRHRCNHCHLGAYRTNRQQSAVATTMWFDATVDADLSDLFNADEYGELGNYYFMDTGMPSQAFDVPHLIDIAAGAPFLHNGAAATMEEIWTKFNMVNRHGVTQDLTREQFNDLIAYLKAQ